MFVIAIIYLFYHVWKIDLGGYPLRSQICITDAFEFTLKAAAGLGKLPPERVTRHIHVWFDTESGVLLVM